MMTLTAVCYSECDWLCVLITLTAVWYNVYDWLCVMMTLTAVWYSECDWLHVMMTLTAVWYSECDWLRVMAVMNTKDKQRLQKNVADLASLDMAMVLPLLVEAGILSSVEHHSIDEIESVEKKTKRLVVTLIGKGYQQYKAFRDVLLEAGYSDIVNVLDNTIVTSEYGTHACGNACARL